ncbi:hypothetical protein LTS10_004835 [Elasticomyces elasticus]|nr:hypothetical protein LTS10_004835 [Elasticomyces elasticus]
MNTDEKDAHLAEQGQSSFSTGSPTSTNITGETLTVTGETGCGNVSTGWTLTLRRLLALVLHRHTQWSGSVYPDGNGVVEPSELPEMTVRSLKDCPLGYPNLATFADSDESFSLYRRFGYLQSRLLLDKQDELRLLEKQLDDMDNAETDPAGLISRNGQGLLRTELLVQIETKFRDYASLLGTAHKLMGFNRPSDSEHKSVLNHIFNVEPVHDTEVHYIYCKEDLVTLRPGRESAWLDRTIEKALRPLNCRIVRNLIPYRRAREKYRMRAKYIAAGTASSSVLLQSSL